MARVCSGAIDIGGTKVDVGIVERGGAVLLHQTFPTPLGKKAASNFVKQIGGVLHTQMEELDLDWANLQGIGIGCAGPVNPEKGTVENPHTLPGWDGFNLVKEFKKVTGLSVVLENDANAGLMGEVVLKHLEKKRVLLIMFGTGIGVAAYSEGRLYRAGRGHHPEMGHMILDIDGPRCYCGHQGCFEVLCSGTALNRVAENNGFNGFDALYEQSQKGNMVAQKIMNTVGNFLLAGVWNLMPIFKPDALILGGGLVRRYFSFFEKTISSNFGNNPCFLNPFNILQAEQGVNSVLIGAAELVFKKTS